MTNLLCNLRTTTQSLGPVLRDLSSETCPQRPGLRDLSSETCPQRPVLRDLSSETWPQRPVLRDLSSETCPQRPGLRDLASETYPQRPVLRDLASETCPQRPVLRDLSSETWPQRPVLRDLSSEACPQRLGLRDLSSETCPQRPVLRDLSSETCPQRPVSVAGGPGCCLLLLLGESGVGKSSVGNTILGRRVFASRPSPRPVTTRIEEGTEEVCGRQVSVVDTPGILNPGALDLIQPLCAQHLLQPDSVVFLVVLKVDQMSSEQSQALQRTMELLGNGAMERSLLLFTYGASLQGESLEDFILEDEVSRLPDIFIRLRKRHHVFDNEAWGPKQVRGLLRTINREFFPGLRPADLDLGPAALDLGPADHDLAELRLVLIGLPGAGKSSSGNTILGQNQFKASCGFDPVSTKAERKTGTVLGRKVTVVDTPGFSDEGIRPKKLFKRIMKSVLELTAGPHAFIIVVRLGRVHPIDTKLLTLIPKLFDETASKFTMVLFTHGDDLGTENVDDLIYSNTTMNTLVQKCERRYCVFNNKSSDPRQVLGLFQQISIMVEVSEQPHCDSKIFKLTTAEIKLFLEKLWKRCGAMFTSCFRPNKDVKDEEMVLLSKR